MTVGGALTRLIHNTVCRYLAWSILAVALIVSTGCTSIGPKKMVPTHEGYNDAVQLTVAREVLKNIVRERYLDPPQYITVTAINAQFSVSAGANVGVGGIGTAGTAGQTGANVGYSDSPTITYVPQFGAGAYKSFVAPVDIQEAIGHVFQWGRMQPYEIALAFGAINDAPDRAGPAGDAFRARVNALARLLAGGATIRYFREFLANQYAPISKEKVDGEAFARAAEAGVFFYEAEEGMLRLGKTVLTLGLVVPRPHEGQAETDLRLLGLTPGEDLYPIRPPGQARPAQLGTLQKNTLWLSTRSVWRIIELTALSVDVPADHKKSGIAPAEAQVNSGVTLPLRIRHSANQPISAYRIQHRGYWFYIDETDTESKQVFVGLVTAYTSRIGSKPPDAQTPTLVLPIGGR